jgi:acyl-CoA thioesterase I
MNANMTSRLTRLRSLIMALLVADLAIFAAGVTALVPTGPAFAADARSKPIKIVAFGDSLTAGFLLTSSQAFPAQLQKAITDKGHLVEIINAGVSGDTTSGGLERLDWSIPDGTDAVILELGANDALRGIAPEVARKNLDAMLAKLKARNIDVLLAGMAAPENWGKDYSDDFNKIYRDLSAQYGCLFYPFFLDGVALKPELNLSDGLHPTGKGIAVIVERMMPMVEQLLERVRTRRLAATNPG